MHIHIQSAKQRAEWHKALHLSQVVSRKRTTVQPHHKAEESSVQRITMGATATSAQVVQELTGTHLGCSDLNDSKFSTSKLSVRALTRWEGAEGPAAHF